MRIEPHREGFQAGAVARLNPETFIVLLKRRDYSKDPKAGAAQCGTKATDMVNVTDFIHHHTAKYLSYLVMT